MTWITPVSSPATAYLPCAAAGRPVTNCNWHSRSITCWIRITGARRTASVGLPPTTTTVKKAAAHYSQDLGRQACKYLSQPVGLALQGAYLLLILYVRWPNEPSLYSYHPGHSFYLTLHKPCSRSPTHPLPRPVRGLADRPSCGPGQCRGPVAVATPLSHRLDRPRVARARWQSGADRHPASRPGVVRPVFGDTDSSAPGDPGRTRRGAAAAALPGAGGGLRKTIPARPATAGNARQRRARADAPAGQAAASAAARRQRHRHRTGHAGT